MPKNKGKGGKKFKKYKKGNNSYDDSFVCKKDNEYYGQLYALVTKMLGNGRLNAICEDSKTRLCSIRGKLKKRKGGNLISAGDIILISKRPFNDKLADVLYKYKDTEKLEFIKGNVAISSLFKDLILGIQSKSSDIVFNNYSYEESDSDSEYDNFDLGINTNNEIEEEKVPDSYDLNYTKEKKWKNKREKTLQKKGRRENNWKSNYMYDNKKDENIDDI